MGCKILIGSGDIDTQGGDGSKAGRAATPDDVAGGPIAFNCAYAPDPGSTGVAKGKFLPSGISWQGFKPGTVDFTNAITFNTTDVYDCNGSKGIHAVVFEVVKFF